MYAVTFRFRKSRSVIGVLRIEGAVDRPFELRYEDLCKMKTQTFAATLECAGNSRVFLVPKAKGVQWQLGAVGNAEWTGVLLKDVLQKAGLKSEACEVILEGADSGTIAELPRPGGKINFARSVPKEKAMDDVLLAFQMNGEPLTAAHGFPLRAIVPGWTRWRQSNGCSASLLLTGHSTAIIKRSITRIGSATLRVLRWSQSPKCRSKPKSRGRKSMK